MSLRFTEEETIRTSSEEDTEFTDAKLLTSFEEWKQIACSWPMKRLVTVWNELPGVIPVRKFTNREIAIERIWRAVHSTENRPEESRFRFPFREGSKAAHVTRCSVVRKEQRSGRCRN